MLHVCMTYYCRTEIIVPLMKHDATVGTTVCHNNVMPLNFIVNNIYVGVNQDINVVYLFNKNTRVNSTLLKQKWIFYHQKINIFVLNNSRDS